MGSYEYNHKKRELKTNQGMVVLNTLISVIGIILIALWIFQANSMVDQDYTIRKQQEQLKQLEKENQQLKARVAQLRFPANLEETARSMDMVEVKNLTYLEPETEVAVR